MRSRFCHTLLILLVCTPVLLKAQGKSALQTSVDSLISIIPGVEAAAFGAITADTTFEFFYGRSDSESMVTNKTLFSLGSSSFMFTSLMLSLQIQHGYMNPRYMIEEVIPGSYRLKPELKGKVNLTHLGTQTSGLIVGDNFSFVSSPSAEWLMNKLDSASIDNKPEYRFHDFNSALLVYILSKHTKKGFYPQVKKNIFDAMGMQHSFVDVPRWYSNKAIDNNDKGPVNFYTTLSDLMNFLRNQLNPPDKKLGKAIQLAHVTHKKGSLFELCYGWEYFPGNEWFLNMSKPSEFNCLFAFDIEKKIGFVFLMKGGGNVKFPNRTYLFDSIRRHLK
ncbi:MAG: serine hydrolase domain-containing protein [Flavitalea sp.]